MQSAFHSNTIYSKISANKITRNNARDNWVRMIVHLKANNSNFYYYETI
jgi:hypothetical protein